MFEFYSPKLNGYLLARGAPASTAEEIVQEVMLLVWRKADQFDASRGSASAWIFTLARNAFIDRVRRENRPMVDPADPLLTGADESPGADALVLGAEVQRQLSNAVRELPPEQRQVVHRSYFEGQSLAQISAADGLPVGTVKTRARLALSRLRALMVRGRET
jgi:RNA polymerase sigma-70 factor (ECF subfamily)